MRFIVQRGSGLRSVNVPIEFVADVEIDSGKIEINRFRTSMDREFLDLYNRELQLLHEQAREFADEYPGIAERLGGLVAERTDPMVAGLLEGAAFLAARVQLKLKHEFPEFTSNLLEQLVPNYLAPTPSAMLAKIVPPFADPALREGGASRAAPISTPPTASATATSPAAIA